MIDSEGRLIPFISAIGNHEVEGGYRTKEEAKIFYRMFSFPQNGYGVLDFSDYMSIIILDTDHTHKIIGDQTNWLAGTMVARSDVPHLFPSYHVGAYPSGRPYNTAVSRRIRENFVPIFEENGVKLAFEHHDHTYERTVPI